MIPTAIQSCPICNGQQFHHYLTAKDHTATGETFNIIKCNDCKFLLTSPQPDSKSIGKYYQSNSYISHSETYNNLFDRVYFLARKIALSKKRKLIERYSKSGFLLDYGCGTGSFIEHMNRHHWKSTGIEPSEKARQIATNLNLDVQKETDSLTKKQFNVITMWHVLEHVHDLNTTLTTLTNLLSPDGTIFIAVPNHKSYDAHHYNSNWAAYDVPRHLWHFTQDNMNTLLQRHHLSTVATIPMKMDSYYVSLLSEKYLHPTQFPLTRLLKAIISGFVSNQKASASTEYSSLIYIAKKK